jgi:hypothetical protein
MTAAEITEGLTRLTTHAASAAASCSQEEVLE